MGLTRKAFAAWIEEYGRAWKARDAKAAADLYAENAAYQVTPFAEPMQGRAAIFEYWTHVAQTEESIQFGYEILALTPEHGNCSMVGFLRNRSSAPQNQAGWNLRHCLG